VIAAIQKVLADQPRTLVSIGLSRAYRQDEHQAARHWLQINNIHLTTTLHPLEKA
jgi:hypothetical protein